MNGYVVLFALMTLLCVSCVFTAYDRGDTLGWVGNAIFAPLMLWLAIAAWGEF